jgi:hypothetical protein
MRYDASPRPSNELGVHSNTQQLLKLCITTILQVLRSCTKIEIPHKRAFITAVATVNMKPVHDRDAHFHPQVRRVRKSLFDHKVLNILVQNVLLLVIRAAN